MPEAQLQIGLNGHPRVFVVASPIPADAKQRAGGPTCGSGEDAIPPRAGMKRHKPGLRWCRLGLSSKVV